MSSSHAAIKKIENRIAVLSKEDPTKNEQVIREFESFREYLLHNINEEDEEEEEYVDLQLLEKKRVVNVIMDLISFDDEHHQSSSFTPDLLNNLQHVVDPMLLLNDNDLDFIDKSVEKLYDCSDYYDDAILDFCQEAKEWLQRPTDDDDVPSGDDDRITVLREHFISIISARDEKVKLNRIKQSEESSKCALALAQSYNNNNEDTNTNSYEESSESDKDSDSDEEKQEKSPILEINREEELNDDHDRLSNSTDKKRFRESDEELQEKSFVLKSLKFEHDGEDARVKGEDVRAK